MHRRLSVLVSAVAASLAIALVLVFAVTGDAGTGDRSQSAWQTNGTSIGDGESFVLDDLSGDIVAEVESLDADAPADFDEPEAGESQGDVAPSQGPTATPETSPSATGKASGAKANAGTKPSPSASSRSSQRPSVQANPSPSTRPSTQATPGAPVTNSAGIWRPEVGTAWQWQLSGNLDMSHDVPVYVVDGVETSAAQVAQLHDLGRRVVCYISAGSWEEWRPDAAKFPAAVLGSAMDGWPGERWLDVRNLDVLLPLMAARMDVCKAKGFDAVEADNVDGYQNATGFSLTGADQIRYNKALATLAHDRGMSIALKNDVEQIPQLVGSFDFAINEECFKYNECDAYRPFIAAGKAVLHVEYGSNMNFCAKTKALGLSSMRKNLALDAPRYAC